ncbi:hypothetical protein D0N36_05430 [Hymenobacter lapidiphilus]|nr:hypothetical protein D0N36_05430 [Hymenobacter sp. CCM 8763]
MNSDKALELLLLHSSTQSNPPDDRWTTGFLGMLRPYKGLIEHNFHEVMLALRVLAPAFAEHETQLSRPLITAVWVICHLGRAWGLEPEGMLQRNNLILPADTERLSEWLSIISDTVSCLLEGQDSEVAFEAYNFYLQDSGQLPL